jgi:hypothetical protein
LHSHFAFTWENAAFFACGQYLVGKKAILIDVEAEMLPLAME